MKRYSDGIVVGFLFGWMCACALIFSTSFVGLQGDMNNDNKLNLKDLSILAETIRNQ